MSPARKIFSIVFTLAVICLIITAIIPAVSGTSTVNLATAGNFAVLGGSTVTNTGDTQINGNLGLSPGTAVTGFPPGIVSGTENITDNAAEQAQTDLIAAINNASVRPDAIQLPQQLGGLTLTPGVYSLPDGAYISTGNLTLNAGTNTTTNNVWIFQESSSLTTLGGYGTILENGAQANNIFWYIGSTANIGDGTSNQYDE